MELLIWFSKGPQLSNSSSLFAHELVLRFCSTEHVYRVERSFKTTNFVCIKVLPDIILCTLSVPLLYLFGEAEPCQVERLIGLRGTTIAAERASERVLCMGLDEYDRKYMYKHIYTCIYILKKKF